MKQNTNRNLYHINDFRNPQSKKIVRSSNRHQPFSEHNQPDWKAVGYGSENLSFGGGGNMNQYITRPEFEEHKRHLDSRFDGVTKDITIAKDEVIRKIEEDQKADKRWFTGLAWASGIALIGVIVTATGILLQAFGVL